MGTVVEITVLNEESRKVAEGAVQAAFDEIKRLENLLGRHQEGSDIWNINGQPDVDVPVSAETIEVIEKGLQFSKLSEGAFDITLGRLSELWNFEGERKVPPTEGEIEEALSGVGAESVQIDKPAKTIRAVNGVRLDLGGIAKGQIIDVAGGIMQEMGVKNFILNAGGDMIIRGRKGNKPWRIGLQHPRKKGEVFAHLDVDKERAAIVTSGDYERYFEHKGKRYHHILDPATGYPAWRLMNSTIVADDAATADAVCTAVFVMGHEAGMRLIDSLEGVEGVLVDHDRNVYISKGLKGKVVIKWKESA